MSVVAYLDTWVLLEVVSKHSDARRESKKRFARLRSGIYIVIVPQPALGEAVAIIMRDFDPDEWEETIGMVMRAIAEVADPATCLQPPSPEAVELATRLAPLVGMNGMSDALITAQAMIDPRSQKLVTRDGLLTGSDELKAEERRMRRDGERSEHLKFGDNL